jgi:exopolyphosphatase/guanosine-5'-triphosphate,3'-diphosphate pyrophosphatase
LQGLGPLRASPAEPVLAALDLGTNNCRLLIARPLADGGFRIVDAFSRIVRLGEGVSLTGRLSEPAMVRTLEALRVCAAKMRRRGVTLARCVATEACRRAVNCAEFVARVRRETGIHLEIITAREEAELAFAGCSPLLDPAWPHAVVFDIGGGSTEIGWIGLGGRRPELIGWLSIPVGVVTLAERHGSAPVPAALFDRMVGEVAALLGPFAASHGLGDAVPARRVQMLGTSGTVTTLAGVHLGLTRYDRNQVDGRHLEFGAIRRVSAMLAEMDCAARAAHPCIGRDRADLVVAGCAILEAICRLWPVGRLRVADRGVREGILLGLSFAAGRAASLAAGAAPRFA